MVGETFGAWLGRQLRRREMTPAEFARRLTETAGGRSSLSGRVSEWLRDLRTPGPKNCRRIADALDLDPDIVLAVAGHRRPEAVPDAGDPRVRIATKLRKVDLAIQGRAETIEGILDLWLDFDRAHRQAPS